MVGWLRPGSRFAFQRQVRQMHRTHRTQGNIFADAYQTSSRPNLEQPPGDHEDIEGDLSWEVEMVVKSEIISYTRNVRRQNKAMKELRYFLKWKGCAEDENTWEPPEGSKNAQEEVERFYRENPEMPGPREVE